MKKVFRKPFATFEVDSKGSVTMWVKGFRIGMEGCKSDLTDNTFKHFHLYKRWKRNFIKELNNY